MFVLDAPFFPNKESGAATFVATVCSSTVSVRLVGLYVTAAEALSPLLGFSLHLLTSSSCCCCLVGHRGTQSPGWATLCLALLHSSNNANYISNGNRWGLVSSSHSLERFTNIHQRGHWSVWAPSFKGWTSQGAGGPRFANYSCSSTLLPSTPPAPGQTALLASAPPFSDMPALKPGPNYKGALNL